ncbi:MAG: TrmH family RNA methyltransferase [Bacteroidota bacterium]
MNIDISSPQNPRVKHVVRLREDGRRRRREGLMLVEGHDELTQALDSGLQPQVVFTAPDLASRPMAGVPSEILTVSEPVFRKMSYRENPDGWLGVFPIPRRSLNDLALGQSPLLIIAESVEKPGNLGAILRTADAAGVDALLLCDPRVDLWNPNVVRASRGTLFTVPAVETDNASALAWLRSRHVQVLAATPSASTLYTAVDLRKPTAVAVGTEDEGLTGFWLANADQLILIPMLGKINSLNVSIAAAVIVYEALRQRS